MAGQVNGDWDSEIELLRLIEALEQRPTETWAEPAYGLVLVNLVGLRHINRTEGRHVGDLVLEELARRLRSVALDAVSVARVGPSEFAVLVDGLSPEPVTQLARRVRRDTALDMTIEGHPLTVELQVTPRARPGDTFINVLWAARSDAQWERQRPLLQRVQALETAVGLDADARAEILDLTWRLSAAEEIAHRDGLTGVLNRIGTEQALAALPTPFALGFVDLDDLRAFNASGDNYEAGDKALRTVARALRAASQDGIVGRWGGDEFVIATPGITHTVLAERLRSILHSGERPPTVAGRPVTFSAGTAPVDSPADLDPARKAAQDILRYIKDNDLKPAVLDHLPGAS
jgi:diguanylate cyclase (GGDEF)-like protein